MNGCRSVVSWLTADDSCERTCKDPHGPVHGTNVAANQHFHQQGEELRPSLGPVPVCDGWHGVRDAGAHLADGFAQAAGQQAPDGGFGLQWRGKQRKTSVPVVGFCWSTMEVCLVPDRWFQGGGISLSGNTSEFQHTASGWLTLTEDRARKVVQSGAVMQLKHYWFISERLLDLKRMSHLHTNTPGGWRELLEGWLSVLPGERQTLYTVEWRKKTHLKDILQLLPFLGLIDNSSTLILFYLFIFHNLLYCIQYK